VLLEHLSVEVKSKMYFSVKVWVVVVCNRLAHDIRSVGFCVHGNEQPVSVKCGNLLDQLRNRLVLKKDTAVPTCLMLSIQRKYY